MIRVLVGLVVIDNSRSGTRTLDSEIKHDIDDDRILVYCEYWFLMLKGAVREFGERLFVVDVRAQTRTRG